ncbi:MAG: immunoglobulin domain-containing protein [Dehalococcoidia bacterium]|nr:immunoglobulin domain-containing protein [Dehalococcoidia bacterium]
MNRIKFNLFLLFVLSAHILCFSAFAEPYLEWQNEYDGSEPNTLVLWNFNSDEIYTSGSDTYAINVITGGEPNAILRGNASFVTGGRFGGGAELPGGADGNDCLLVPDSASIFPSGADPNLSVEAWVKLDTLDPASASEYRMIIIDKQYTDNSGYTLYYTNQIDYWPRFVFTVGDGTNKISAYYYLPLQTDTWYHVAGTWNAQTDTVYIYVNGRLADTTESPGSSLVNNTRDVRLGNRLSTIYSAVDGVIDGVRISDVAYEFSVPLNPPYDGSPYYDWQYEYDGNDPNTLYLWNFNSDELIMDDQRAINMSAVTGIKPPVVLYGYTEFVEDGKFGYGAELHGGRYSGDVLYPYPPITDLFAGDTDPSFTVETWVYFNGLSQNGQYVIDKQYDKLGGLQIKYYSDGGQRFDFRFGDDSEQRQIEGYVPDLVTGRWYHLACTWDALDDTARMYLDGVTIASATFPGSTYQEYSSYAVRIGNRQGSTYGVLDGKLDGFRISNTAYKFGAVVPVVVEQPKDTAGDIGDAVSFTVTATSLTPMHYAWYKSADANVSVDDSSVGTDSNTLDVTITSSSDEAYYYCKMSNDDTEPNGVYPKTVTNTAELAIKRLLARYKFEQNANDSIGGKHGTVVDTSWNPVTGAYDEGIIDDNCVELLGTDEVVLLPSDAYPNTGLASGLRQGTITAWFKTPDIVSGYNNLIIANYNASNNSAFGLYVQDDNDAGFWMRGSDGKEGSSTGRPGISLQDDQWHMMAVTYNGSDSLIAVYVDGESPSIKWGTLSNLQFSAWDLGICIGSGRGGTGRLTPTSLFNGSIDDLRVYNYVLSGTQIADIYLGGYPSATVCVDERYGSEFDFNDDCRVNLVDFADVADEWITTYDWIDLDAFAQEWLSCGFYPSGCN